LTAMPELTFPEYQPFPNEASRNWRQEHIEIPLMIVALGLPRGGRVLEIGCGRGIALPVLARCLAPIRLVGLDVDPTLLDPAGRRLHEAGTSAELVLGDVRRLPFPDGDFDLIIDFGTCFHIARADEALREISRALVAGGIFATETKLNQLFSHPLRSLGRFLPWSAASGLVHQRHAGLWQSRSHCP
jgi:ubiquinone/menaquinone biosynthesis C-methylase UbiE